MKLTASIFYAYGRGGGPAAGIAIVIGFVVVIAGVVYLVRKNKP